MWLCLMASSPMRAVVRLAWERVFPPAGLRFASPASHRAVGFHALMGYGLPVPFLVIALGMVGTAVSPRHLGVAHTSGWTGQSPCQFIACRPGLRAAREREKAEIWFGSRSRLKLLCGESRQCFV